MKHFHARHPLLLGVHPSTAEAEKLAEGPAIQVPQSAFPRDFSAIYAQWFRPVYRWVRALGGPQAEVEDIAQEIFVVVQRNLPRFDGQNLPGWLYGITTRTVSDYRRRRWFRNTFLRSREVMLEEIETGSATSEELLQRKQEQQRFYRLLASMNAKWRDSFILFEIEGYSGDEIAALKGIPAATVRTHLHRARKEFLQLVVKEKRS